MFDLQSIMMIKGMALLLFLGASFFALRLQDAFVYFLAIVMSGILFIMPNTSALFPLLTALPVIIYLLGSFLVPLLLNRKRDGVQHQVFSLIALPISALVVSYMIYQFGQERFPGIAMGLAYILQA